MSSCRTILKDNTTQCHRATRCHMMPPNATKHSIMPHITKRCFLLSQIVEENVVPTFWAMTWRRNLPKSALVIILRKAAHWSLFFFPLVWSKYKGIKNKENFSMKSWWKANCADILTFHQQYNIYLSNTYLKLPKGQNMSNCDCTMARNVFSMRTGEKSYLILGERYQAQNLCIHKWLIGLLFSQILASCHENYGLNVILKSVTLNMPYMVGSFRQSAFQCDWTPRKNIKSVTFSFPSLSLSSQRNFEQFSCIVADSLFKKPAGAFRHLKNDATPVVDLGASGAAGMGSYPRPHFFVWLTEA